MPGLTELTVVGDAGHVRIQLEDHSDVTVADILLATAAPCTGIAETAVDAAIETGRLQLVDGDQELDVDQPADVIDHDPVLIRLVGINKDRPRRPRAADTRNGDVALTPPAPARSDHPPAPFADAPAAPALLVPPAASLPAAAATTTGDGEPAVILLPRKAGRAARLAGAYRAMRDATAQSNGLPAPPTVTRAKQAWRRSEYVGTLTRGIAEPELTQSAVLAFLSSKGGVGKTTTAKLVAMAFADARRDRCVLIDANPDRGTLGTSLARGHTVYVDDVRAAAERPHLSPSDLDGMLAHGPHGLRVLPAPQNSNRRRQLSADDYTAVIDCLRRHAGIVVIDLGTDMLEGPTVAALKAAHQLIVISNDDWIAGEQTAASFWDDVRATSAAEYTIVANDITGSHRHAGERLHGQLTQAPGADSNPRSVTVVSHNTGAYNKLQDRTVEWADLPRQWQRSARELAYRLAQDWPRLGIARQSLSSSAPAAI